MRPGVRAEERRVVVDLRAQGSADRAGDPLTDRNSSAAASIPAIGHTRYSQAAVHSSAGSAEATVRAGFMPNPENGDSKVAQVATSSATA